MVVVQSWCGKCQKMVIPDVEMKRVLSSTEIRVFCKGWFCPLCGGDLGSKNVGLPTAYVASAAPPTGYEKYGD